MFSLLKKNRKSILTFFVSSLVMFLPVVVLAQNAEIDRGLLGIGSLFGGSGLAGSRSLTGPNGLIANVIRLLLLLAGSLAVLFVIIGGYQYITAGGNEEQAEKGRGTLVNALIGIVIIVLAYVIVNVIARAATNFQA